MGRCGWGGDARLAAASSPGSPPPLLRLLWVLPWAWPHSLTALRRMLFGQTTFRKSEDVGRALRSRPMGSCIDARLSALSAVLGFLRLGTGPRPKAKGEAERCQLLPLRPCDKSKMESQSPPTSPHSSSLFLSCHRCGLRPKSLPQLPKGSHDVDVGGSVGIRCTQCGECLDS